MCTHAARIYIGTGPRERPDNYNYRARTATPPERSRRVVSACARARAGSPTGEGCARLRRRRPKLSETSERRSSLDCAAVAFALSRSPVSSVHSAVSVTLARLSRSAIAPPSPPKFFRFSLAFSFLCLSHTYPDSVLEKKTNRSFFWGIKKKKKFAKKILVKTSREPVYDGGRRIARAGGFRAAA